MVEDKTRQRSIHKEIPVMDIDVIEKIGVQACLGDPTVKLMSETTQGLYATRFIPVAIAMDNKFRGRWNSIRPLDCFEQLANTRKYREFKKLVRRNVAESIVTNYLHMRQEGVQSMEELRKKQKARKQAEKSTKTGINLQEQGRSKNTKRTNVEERSNV